MAEKRVSVRLVAEGGRQVRAEFEGIGEAGTRGFGRLSSEMELANARLGSFARKAGIALAAVTAAAVATGVAMVRSGLDVIGAQADMAASLRTTVESLQVLTWAGELAGVSMGEIEQATKKLTTRLSEAAAGSGSAVGALQRLNLTAALCHEADGNAFFSHRGLLPSVRSVCAPSPPRSRAAVRRRSGGRCPARGLVRGLRPCPNPKRRRGSRGVGRRGD